MKFYHDKKAHMSPSALANWINSPSAFIKSYFLEEKGPETKAMSMGTKIHALIEGGMIKARHAYDTNEQELKFEVAPGTGLYFMGKPDSFEHEQVGGAAMFVDYKSGKANAWAEKLPTDVKMRATAWLVWKATGEPNYVMGYIEYIETVWNPDAHDIELVEGKETEVIKIQYTRAEMESFTDAILKAMRDVNDFYEKWLKSSGDFVNSNDIEQALRMRAGIAALEKSLAEIEDRIASQMEFGGEETHKVEGGTYYFRKTEKFEYPPELEFLLDGSELVTLEKAERVAAGVKAAKQNYELVNVPVEVKKTISFRASNKK